MPHLKVLFITLEFSAATFSGNGVCAQSQVMWFSSVLSGLSCDIQNSCYYLASLPTDVCTKPVHIILQMPLRVMGAFQICKRCLFRLFVGQHHRLASHLCHTWTGAINFKQTVSPARSADASMTVDTLPDCIA